MPVCIETAWRAGDKVRWRDRVGTFRREVDAENVEIVIESRVYRGPHERVAAGMTAVAALLLLLTMPVPSADQWTRHHFGDNEIWRGRDRESMGHQYGPNTRQPGSQRQRWRCRVIGRSTVCERER